MIFKTEKFHKSFIRFTISVLLCLCFIFSSLPTVFAADKSGKCGDKVKWEIKNNTLILSGSGDMDNFNDVSFSPWNSFADEIYYISFSSKITSIGKLSFYGLKNLRSAELPEALVRVGDYAFAECEELVSVKFNQSLKAIGDSAFQSCRSVVRLDFPNTLESIGTKAFYRCYSIATLDIPKSVKNIGVSSFAYCTGLISADINADIGVLPQWMFYGCSMLSSVVLSASIKETSEYTFQRCENLTSVYTLSDDVEVAYKIEQSIKANNDDFNGNGFVGMYFPSEIAVSGSDDGNNSITSILTQSDNATVNVEETVKDYNSDDKSTSTVVSGVVNNSEGFDEVKQAAQQAIDKGASDSVTVEIHIDGTEVDSDDIEKFAGMDVELVISTATGSDWKIDMSDKTEDDFKGSYDLDIKVTDADENVKIEAEKVYKVDFEDNIDFKTTVGIPVGSYNVYKLATLYEKNGSKYTKIQTVVVDSNGKAWFRLAQIGDRAKYFIAINAEGETYDTAYLGEENTAGFDISGLTYIGNGVEYEITGRKSAFGISGGAFALYAGIAILVVIIVVSGIMILLNKLKKSKEKYAAASDGAELDESAIRLEVMKELLDQQKDKKDSNKKDKKDKKDKK